MYDIKLILNSYATAQTSSGYGKDTSGDAIYLDLCGEGKDCKWQGRLIVRVDQIAWDIFSPNQSYKIYLLGGNDSSFTKEVVLAHLELGAAAACIGNQKLLAGVYELLVQNEMKGVIYPYVRIRHVLAGNNPRIIYRANLGKLH